MFYWSDRFFLQLYEHYSFLKNKISQQSGFSLSYFCKIPRFSEEFSCGILLLFSGGFILLYSKPNTRLSNVLQALTVSKGLFTRDICVCVNMKRYGFHGTKWSCLHITSVFASNAENGCGTHSLHLCFHPLNA